MNKRTLLLFIQRILSNGSDERAQLSLRQLAEILKMQDAPHEFIELTESSADALPEAKAVAMDSTLSEEALREAISRAERRRRWEAAAAQRGRC